MEAQRNVSLFPILAYGRVTAYDVVNHQVYVTIQSLQMISVAAKVLIYGNADATRVNQEPLPVIGTIGLIAVPFGDTKSVIWLGSFYNSQVNSVTTSNPPMDQDSQMKYFSHASGSWSLLDYTGNYFTKFADGTIVGFNNTGTEPTIYNHTVDPNNNQLTNTVTDKSRNLYPPGAFTIFLDHPSGASATITPNGMVTITAGNPQLSTINMTPNGIITVTAGNPVSGSQATPEIILNAQTGEVSIYSQNQNGLITMDGSGNITIKSATGNIAIAAAKQISIEADSSGIAMSLYTPNGDIGITTKLYSTTMNTFIANYNEHYHGGVTTGTSNTEPTDPTDQIPLI